MSGAAAAALLYNPEAAATLTKFGHLVEYALTTSSDVAAGFLVNILVDK